MKRAELLIIIFLTVLGCSKDSGPTAPLGPENPSEMVVFCQASPEDKLSSVEYDYDIGNLMTETWIRNGAVQNETTFAYRPDNRILLEVYSTDSRKTEKTYIYDNDLRLTNILYRIIDFDGNGKIINESQSEAPREYQNDQLVKEWESWGGFKIFEYGNGKVTTKIDHTKNGQEHHITTYKYSGGLLIQEIMETKTGGLLYLKTFIYDSQNRLIKVLDGKNVIEENDYVDNRLTEKRTYYFGIDPGYDFCYGNYIYRYHY